MIFEFDSKQITARFDNSEPKLKTLAHCVERVVLSDGRIAEVQVIVTCEENKFVREVNTMTGWAAE